jgi:chromosome segregation ATPase
MRSKISRREADFHVPLTRGRRDSETIDSVTDSIMLHKQQLDNLSQKVERLRNEQAPVVVKSDAAELQNKIDRLELLLEEKDEALLKLRHDNGIIEMMTSKLEEAQRESDSIQERLPELEKQAGIATKLIMDLDEVREDYTQLQKEQQHNQEKLREVLSENARLHQQLYETDDKLQEAKLERQQLMKRARLIEELNTDFQSVSDNNFKMKSELRRVGELESMLNMMTEERDRLLHRGNIRAV